MEANLTGYDILAEGDRHESELVVEQSESGEWVKFADVKDSLSKSHNSAMDAIVLAEAYAKPFNPSTSVIGKVMEGFIYWLQEQQHQ